MDPKTKTPEEMADLKRFGARLRDLRVSAGLTQTELAEQIGLGQTGVSHTEIAIRTTTIEKALAWARVCGGSIVVEGGKDDPMRKLLNAAAGAGTDELLQLARGVAALRALSPERREEEVRVLEARAGIGR